MDLLEQLDQAMQESNSEPEPIETKPKPEPKIIPKSTPKKKEGSAGITKTTRVKAISNTELNEKLEKVLKLAELGKSHELTVENMINFIKMKKTIKPYELRWYFDAYDSNKIEKMLKLLFNKKIVRRNNTKWYLLTRNYVELLNNIKNDKQERISEIEVF